MQWSKWRRDFSQKIEDTSGKAAVASSALGVAGAVAAGPWGLTAAGVGVVFSVLYAGFSSFPERQKSPSELVGKKIPIEEIIALDPRPLLLAVVGASQSGKSTFLSTAQQTEKPSTRTNKIYGEIMMLPGREPDYIALLDADGKEFYQQFEIVEKADFIIFFIDHNISAVDEKRAEDRLKEHENFIEQIEPVLKKRINKPKVHLLLNKRDLWERGSDADGLKKWFEDYASDWEKRNLSKEFSFDYHTNMTTDDTAKMMKIIRQCVSSKE